LTLWPIRGLSLATTTCRKNGERRIDERRREEGEAGGREEGKEEEEEGHKYTRKCTPHTSAQEERRGGALFTWMRRLSSLSTLAFAICPFSKCRMPWKSKRNERPWMSLLNQSASPSSMRVEGATGCRHTGEGVRVREGGHRGSAQRGGR
jgi:hypothetical protein